MPRRTHFVGRRHKRSCSRSLSSLAEDAHVALQEVHIEGSVQLHLQVSVATQTEAPNEEFVQSQAR